MKLYRFVASITLIGILLFNVLPVTSEAKLRRSDPAPDAVLDRAPSEIFVWYSEPLSTGSSLNIFDEQFQPVDRGQTFIDASDATLMRAPLKQLAPGHYTVKWKASAVNGHFAGGTYNFVVRDTTDFRLILVISGVPLAMLLLVVIAIRAYRKRQSAF
jgi:methionine-rich copper-binding protein CopC